MRCFILIALITSVQAFFQEKRFNGISFNFRRLSHQADLVFWFTLLELSNAINLIFMTQRHDKMSIFSKIEILERLKININLQHCSSGIRNRRGVNTYNS